MATDQLDDESDITPPILYPDRWPVPFRTRMAGIMWACFGCLILINVLWAIAQIEKNRIDNANPTVALIFAVLGFVILFIGRRTALGRARGTFFYAVFSMILGFFQFVAGLIIIVTSVLLTDLRRPLDNIAVIRMGVFSGVAGVGLISAGVLAMRGRQEYADWRLKEERRRSLELECKFEERAVTCHPGAVRLAGAIWVTVGISMISGAIAYGICVTTDQDLSAAGIVLGCLPALGFSLLGVVLFLMGKTCWRGTVRDTFGQSFASLVVGFLGFLAGAFVVLLAFADSYRYVPTSLSVMKTCGSVSIFFGVLLMMAGILGFVGRSDFRSWRYWQEMQHVEK